MIEEPRDEYEASAALAAPPDLSALEPEDSIDLSPKAWRLPVSLRIIAFVFSLFGILCVVEVIVQYALFRSTNINFGVLTVFIGSGLRKWRDSSRRWAVLWSWLFLIGLGVWWTLALYVVFGGRFSGTVHGLTPAGLAFGTCLTAYLIWQIRVLRRPEVLRRFRFPQSVRAASKAHDRNRQHWLQFSLGSLLLAMIVVTFVMVRVTSNDVRYKLSDATVGLKDGTCHYGVQTSRFGVERDRLAYVIMMDKNTQAYVLQGLRGATKLWLQEKNLQIDLPGRHQLIEVVDGQVRTRNERVTLTEMQSFLKSQSTDDWTLDGLIRHAEELRAKEAK
jgi:hypothetical protein